jgi:hypothetical protein
MTGTTYPVTGRDIPFKPFGRYTGFDYKIVDVDVERRTVEMILRFEPNAQCFYHRHLGPVASVVLEGEHHVRHVDEAGVATDQVRTCGEFTMSHDESAHIEGGGPEGGTILFSLRGDQDHLYDILDDQLQLVHEVTVQDFRAALDDWQV